MADLDLLLHPVRLRIVQALLDGHPSTTTQLRERLPEIAPATMYRHVAVLADAGVLEVLQEKRVRGIMERTYRLRWDRAQLDESGRAAMTPDDHRRAFTAFTGSLLAEFGQYLARDPADPVADGVTYQQAAVWLTDEEHAELLAELRAAVTARTGRSPGEGRTRRMVSLVAMPAEE
ncbi:helix-turn-helix domain-containing protein [Lentzea sp. HUAS12]|uniref:helix-turn-helix domain-containing protein n=1 Tax=Lentzea sp. HUAS12 TaxID=2951806 RepID=UPI0020A05E05|nr:helix-turn-helix domain-containing protein [Lentzea sp. HUAS12]USX53159.1 helix-turn-helix domain-containing protein [Lentzea sp. HUAS12]